MSPTVKTPRHAAYDAALAERWSGAYQSSRIKKHPVLWVTNHCCTHGGGGWCVGVYPTLIYPKVRLHGVRVVTMTASCQRGTGSVTGLMSRRGRFMYFLVTVYVNDGMAVDCWLHLRPLPASPINCIFSQVTLPHLSSSCNLVRKEKRAAGDN